jgi:imidazolonepropionase
MKKLITNIGQLVTPASYNFAAGNDMKKIKIYHDCSMLIEDGIIAELFEKEEEKLLSGIEEIDAQGMVVMPSFTDPHTHIPFAGTRENEFNLRIQGKTYMEIAAMGGGINSTVKATRKASEEEIYNVAKENLERMIAHGVATFEIKSGYGLDTDTELKQLRVIKKLADNYPVDIKATFLGAHEIPLEYREKKREFIDLILSEMLPAAKEQGIAEYCDIFTETGVFDIEESRVILKKAKELGFKIRMHADELTPLGGAELAAEMDALSADHLVHISDTGIEKMVEKQSVFVMLPGTTFFLMSDTYAPAKKIIEKGGIVALSTDFNPGSSHTHSMPLVITIACLKMGLTIEEAICAATLNGAYSLELSDKTGSIHKGKQADLIFLDAPDYQFLVYNFGVNRIKKVMKKGKIIYSS